MRVKLYHQFLSEGIETSNEIPDVDLLSKAIFKCAKERKINYTVMDTKEIALVEDNIEENLTDLSKIRKATERVLTSRDTKVLFFQEDDDFLSKLSYVMDGIFMILTDDSDATVTVDKKSVACVSEYLS